MLGQKRVYSFWWVCLRGVERAVGNAFNIVLLIYVQGFAIFYSDQNPYIELVNLLVSLQNWKYVS